MASDDLAGIDIRSGVNGEGEGFCTVVATAQGGRMLLGQLPPAEVRAMAVAWLEAAEAADQDAAMWRCIRKLGLAEDLAALVISELRDSRDQ